MEASSSLNATEVAHPLVAASLGLLRDKNTPKAAFAAALAGVGALLFWEASRALRLATTQVTTPGGAVADVSARPDTIVLLPILRAGLGFLRGIEPWVPGATVATVGISRDHTTLEPRIYHETLPPLAGRDVFVLEPMLATGGSACAVLERVRAAQPASLTLLSVLAAPVGLATVHQTAPETRVFVAAIDEGLDARGYIVPGLGDAGDRLLGT